MGSRTLRLLSALILFFFAGCASQQRPVWSDEDRAVCNPEKLKLPQEAMQLKRHWFQTEGIPPGIVEKVLRANYECGKHLADELQKERSRERCDVLCQGKVFLSGVGTGFVLSLFKGAP